MVNTTSNISNRVQLLLHTEDGFIPFLTPYLLQTYFSPNSKDIKDHLVLGVAIKDTCIGPIYRDDTPNTSSSNNEGSEKDDKRQSKNKQKRKRKSNDVDKEESDPTKRQRVDNSSSAAKNGTKSSVNNTLKPIGYKFDSVVHKRLLSAQIPGYNKVLVPTFDLIDDLKQFTSGKISNVNENNYGKKKKDDNGQNTVSKKDVVTNNNQNGNHRPTIASTNNQISLCTPHGVQKLDFDTYLKITREVQVDSFFGMYDQVHVEEKKKRREKCIDRTKNWMKTIMTEKNDNTMKMKRVWYPLDCNATFLDEKSLGDDISSMIPQDDYISGIVMVGWHHRKSKEERIKLLQISSNLLQNVSLKFIVPATNDLSQIIEAVKHGASMFGCDLVAKWARARKALALTLIPGQYHNNNNGTNTKIGDSQKLDENGCIDLSDPSFAWDKSPILPSCECFSAKYTRSYIHHLIQAKELLADIILFGHNLNQMILLCKEFTAARQEGKIDEFCTFLQGQLKTNNIN